MRQAAQRRNTQRSARVSRLFILLVCALVGIGEAASAGGTAWTAFVPSLEVSETEINHGPWDAFLASYLRPGEDGIHRLAYAKVSPTERKALDAYLENLTRIEVTQLSRAEQLPYWINLYNALTVRTVLAHYPVTSIRKIRPGWLSLGPWKEKWIEVEGHPVSLDDIEHRILRPIWRDPRIHYAVNCASLGCPNLQAKAFTRANTEALLEEAAGAYVNHPRGASFRGHELVVSSIYRWFREDFGDSDAGVLLHLRQHAEPDLAARLGEVDEIADDIYDWRLNDAP